MGEGETRQAGGAAGEGGQGSGGGVIPIPSSLRLLFLPAAPLSCVSWRWRKSPEIRKTSPPSPHGNGGWGWEWRFHLLFSVSVWGRGEPRGLESGGQRSRLRKGSQRAFPWHLPPSLLSSCFYLVRAPHSLVLRWRDNRQGWRWAGGKCDEKMEFLSSPRGKGLSVALPRQPSAGHLYPKGGGTQGDSIPRWGSLPCHTDSHNPFLSHFPNVSVTNAKSSSVFSHSKFWANIWGRVSRVT